jgi:hypothetical protein
MAYYDFLMTQWSLGKLTEVQIQSAVTKGYITQDEANAILSTPKSV